MKKFIKIFLISATTLSFVLISFANKSIPQKVLTPSFSDFHNVNFISYSTNGYYITPSDLNAVTQKVSYGELVKRPIKPLNIHYTSVAWLTCSVTDWKYIKKGYWEQVKPKCKDKWDFSTKITDMHTNLYAHWKRV